MQTASPPSGAECYGDPDQDPTGELEFLDESSVKLGQLVSKGAKFIYRYDFGDNWEHRIKVEALDPTESAPLSFASLITGKRACPPEDVGGIRGYEEFLEAVKDPHSERGQEMLDWVCREEFDPDYFDLEKAKTAVLEISMRRKVRSAAR